jgi:phospholipase C
MTDSALESIRRQGIDRRRFLYLTGGAAATSLLSDSLMSSIARAAEIPAHRRTGTLRDVEHIVVLMQENRSFDHYFGSVRGVRGFGDPHPVTLASGKSVWHQSDGTRDILPFRPSAANLGLQFLEDLPHGWNDTQAAWNHGKYDQWIPAKSAVAMAYLTRQDIPFHYALADAFTICDAYHCSFMGSTDPNRYYMWTGYTGNDGAGGGPVLGNDEVGYSWTTYPERLERAGISWKIYQDIGDGLDAAGTWGWIEDAYRGNYGDNSLLYFNQYRNATPGDPLYDKARTGTNAKQGQGLFDIFAADVKSGALPQVSWIVAPEAFSEHPNWPANYGAWYIAQVLNALTARPDVWSRTVLLITYDENDGFFDHMVPGLSPVDCRSRYDHGPRCTGPVCGLGHAAGRTLWTGPARPDARRVSLEQGRLGVLAGPRPYVDRAVHRAAVRRARAAHLAVATGGVRRPHRRLRLRSPRERDRWAAGHFGLQAIGPRAPSRLRTERARHLYAAGTGAGPAACPSAAVRPVRRRHGRPWSAAGGVCQPE